MEEKQSIADVAERVQRKLRPTIVHEKNEYPLLEKATVHHGDNENVAPHGVTPKGRKELHLNES